MKKIAIVATTLFFMIGVSAFSQTEKKTTTATKTETKAIPATAKPENKPGKQPQTPTAATARPSLSKEDSLKRQHKLDSIRKVVAAQRVKEGYPKLSKEDSIKRAARIDSLRKVARERQKQNAGKAPHMSKEDSLKRVHKIDSMKKSAELKKAKAPAGKK